MPNEDNSLTPYSGAPTSRTPTRPGETLVEWPHCPACGAARTTQCPACDTEGATWEQAFGPTLAEFERGDADPSPAQHRAAVICPTCDEVFRPVFARRCTACKHTFAEQESAQQHPLSDSTKRRRTPAQTARMIFSNDAVTAEIYTLYDWLMSNSGGIRKF